MPAAEPLVLDTHVWLDVAIGRGRMKPRMRRKIDAAAIDGALYVAAITPWEIAMLARADALLVTRDGTILDYAEEAKAVRAVEPS